ncbi:MAG: hypothetical protein JNK29_05910, partial [Anaerolineales bacterium]|nr:hypothetical protein [Anaerolineales bacterium]
VVVAAWGVEAPGWAPGLWAASLSGAVGVLAGLVLAKSRFNGWVATLFAACYGLFIVGFLTCLLLRGDWHNRVIELLIRVNNFIYYALNGGTSRDILPFPVFVGLSFWGIGVGAAWAIFRRSAVWPAIIPAGVVLLVNAYYYVGEQLEVYLGAYLVLALLLLTRMNLLANEREWRASRVHYTPDARFEFLRAGLSAAVVLVFLAWLGQNVTVASASPSAAAAWDRVNGAWATVRENFERLFNAVRNPGLAAQDFYGDSLSLSGATSLSERLIMNVKISPVIEEGVPDENETYLNQIPRYYWRATAYQEYVAGRWQAGDALEFREQDPARPGGARLAAYRLRRDVSALFTSELQAASRLYVLPQPRLVDRPTTFETFIGPGDTLDPVSVRAQTILTGEDRRYRVIASVSVADVASLRSAGENYPEWVRAFFLQLPETVTPRTRDLARQIVTEAGAANAYDRAQAITNWLRQNIEYDQAIAAPPSAAEPVDWFLFETRRGYCNYYASAMVVLLRSLGIPARLAVGFAEGQLDLPTGQYVVRERNAHAWPEVYFPEYGWIEFEPTGSEPPLERPERQIVADTPLTPNDAEPPVPDDAGRDPQEREPEAAAARPGVDWGQLLQRWGTTLAVGGGGLALLILVSLSGLLRADLIGLESLGRPGRQVLRWLGRVVPSAVTMAYRELERAARWLGLKLPANFTPRERAVELTTALPQAAAAVDTITAQYMAEQYSPYPEAANGQLAQRAWQGIQRVVWTEGLRQAVRRAAARWRERLADRLPK